MQLKVHITHGRDRNTYRIALEDEVPINNYEYLRALLVQTFPELQNREFRITWLDSDSDQVTIASSADLRTFLLSNLGKETKTLYVETRNDSSAPGVSVHFDQSLPASGYLIHSNVDCDNCNASVTGNRYKCVECPDYDLCVYCEAAGEHSEHVMMRTADVQLFSSDTGRIMLENVAHLMRMVRGTVRDGRREHREAKRCFKQLRKHGNGMGHHGGPKRRDGECPKRRDGEGRDWPYGGMTGTCPIVDQVHLEPLLNMGMGFVHSLYDQARTAAATAATAAAQASTSSATGPDAAKQAQPSTSSAPPVATDQTVPQPETTNQQPEYQLPPFNFHDMLQNLMGHIAQASQPPQPTQPQTNTANVVEKNASAQDTTTTAPVAGVSGSGSSPAVSIHSVYSTADASGGMEVDPKDKDVDQQDWTLLRAEDDHPALPPQAPAITPQAPEVVPQAPATQQVYPTLASAPEVISSSSNSPVLRLLHEMGFNHDDRYLNHLLVRYENNISQVVKHLVDVSNGANRV